MGVHAPPFAVAEGRARRLHRAVDVRRPRLGHLGDHLAGGRVHGGEAGAVLRVGPVVPDPEPGADRFGHGIAGARQLPENSGFRFST